MTKWEAIGELWKFGFYSIKLTYPVRSGEAGNPGRKMNDVTPGVVHDTPLEQKSATPQAESTHRVRKRQPQRHEHHPRLEVHPPKHRPRQQNQCDGREHTLKPHHRSHRIQRLGLRGFDVAVVAEVVGAGGESCPVDEELLAQSRASFAPEREEFVPEGHLVGPAYPAEDHSGKSVESHEG